MTETYVALDDDVCAARFVTGVPAVIPGHSPTTTGPPPPMLRWIMDTRQLGADAARARASCSARQALEWQPSSRLLLHAEPGLRGHLWEEYEAVAEVAYPDLSPVLLLVPAVPAAGHQVKAGVQFLTDDYDFLPASTSPFAADPQFGFQTARLLDYAEARSGGRLDASRGSALTMRQLLNGGAEAVSDALLRAGESGTAAAAGPSRGSVLVVDAATDEHLQLIADGLLRAWAAGVTVIPRVSAPLSAMVAGCYTDDPLSVDSDHLLLVIDAAATTGEEQRRQLHEHHPHAKIADVSVGADILATHQVILTHGSPVGSRVLGRLASHLGAGELTVVGHLDGGAVAYSFGAAGPVVACLPYDIDGAGALAAAANSVRPLRFVE